VANFLKPSYEVASGFAAKPNGLAYVYAAMGRTRDVALWGGDGLWVGFNDFDSAACPARCAETTTAGSTYRFFTITPRHVGHTMLEARMGGRSGALWDFVQVVVDESIAWGAKVSHAFKTKVLTICRRLKVETDYLMSCMAFETGKSFSPSIHNAAGSGAVGLIQFMPATARAMHTTTAALGAMTAVQQLDYVERYFASRIATYGQLRSLEDVYMSILYPAAIGQPDTHVLFNRGTTAYTQNAGLDSDRDGVITKFEGASAVRKMLVEGRSARYHG
jgi:hypothetical protein